jgi:hypothetical protein
MQAHRRILIPYGLPTSCGSAACSCSYRRCNVLSPPCRSSRVWWHERSHSSNWSARHDEIADKISALVIFRMVMHVYGAHLCGLFLDHQACSAASQMQWPSSRCSHGPKTNGHLPLRTHSTKRDVLSLQLYHPVSFTKFTTVSLYLWEWSGRFPKHLHRSDPCSKQALQISLTKILSGDFKRPSYFSCRRAWSLSSSFALAS